MHQQKRPTSYAWIRNYKKWDSQADNLIKFVIPFAKTVTYSHHKILQDVEHFK